MNNSITKSLLLRGVSAAMVSSLLLLSANLSAQTGDTVNQATPNTNSQQDHGINQPNSFGEDPSSAGTSSADDGITSNRTTNRRGDDGAVSDQNWRDRGMQSKGEYDTGVSDTNRPSPTDGAISSDSSQDSALGEDSSLAADSENAQPGSITSGTTYSGQVVHLSSDGAELQEVPVNSLANRKILNLQQKEIGEVSQVIQSQDGSGALLVKAGGFIGIGKKEVVVPLDSVRLSGNQLIWETQLDAAQIKDSQEFKYDESRYSSVVDDE